MTTSHSSQAYTPDQLVAGELPLLSRQITLLSGQNLARGAVLGKVTASGKYKLSAAGAGDGSETPDAILAEATDASSGDKQTVAYFRGDFNENQVTLGAGHTVDSIREGLRGKGIWLVPAQAVE